MPRTLNRNWIDVYTESLSTATRSPARFHFWSAASCIASTLKRSVWIDQPTWRMYPNLYVVLVGRPGIGKGAAMNPAISLLKEAGTSNVLSDRITMEYVLEKLSKGFPKISKNGNATGIQLGKEASTLIVSTELSVFITASQFSITCLTDLWDCREGVYQYGTRGKGEWNINEPLVNLLGASAQEWLVKSIPADAVGGGFTRRVNFVLGTKEVKVAGSREVWDAYKPLLVEDLRYMSLLRGPFKMTKSAEKLLRIYQDTCDPDEFDDMASSVYKASKWTNAAKLAQVLSVSRGDDMTINELDLQMAIDKIEDVAKDLKRVFRSVGESDLANASDRVIRFLEAKGYASRQDILAFNWRNFTSNELDVILATFRESGMIGERSVGNKILYYWKDSAKP